MPDKLGRGTAGLVTTGSGRMPAGAGFCSSLCRPGSGGDASTWRPAVVISADLHNPQTAKEARFRLRLMHPEITII
ncbi:hypothetical protein [Streptomyces anthocyanicus]|uniref:hypothetical protein n=1 Tax=Streptomyces anthocyanicus TaxID=68174 RepID=UPI003867798D